MASVYHFWFALNNGFWNNNPAADPATDVGGVDLSGTLFEGNVVGPIVQGTGDAGITANFGATPFTYAVPTGYYAGFPDNTGTGSTNFAPGFTAGSAVVNPGGLQVSFPASPGGAYALNGTNEGKYYWELVNPTGDIFSADWGGGIGNDFSIPGFDLNYWINNGAYGPGNDIGGILITGQTLVNGVSSLCALGSTVVPSIFNFALNSNNVLRIAAFLSDEVPPPAPEPTPAVVIPQSLGRWRGQVGINWNGLALVGDAFTNVVGLSDFDIFNEYGNGMRLLATLPPLHEDRKRIFVSRFEIEVEAGEGLPDAPQTAPTLMLDYSKDGGKTWVPLQAFRSMGRAGEFIKRLRWINLGQSRTWVFRLQYSDTARPAIIGTYMDIWKALG